MPTPAFTRLFGYSFDEVIGRTTEFLYADKRDYLYTGKKYYNMAVKIGNQGYEMAYRRKDGSTFKGESVSTLVRGLKGRIVGFVGVHRDISVRNEIEAILKRDKDTLERLVSERTAELLKLRPKLEKAKRLSDKQPLLPPWPTNCATRCRL